MDTVLQNCVDAITLGSLYALFSLGIALIFGIMQLINFAHGELIMVGAYGVVLLHGDWLLIIPLVVIIVIVFALGMERAAFRPVRGADPATLLVTSFAVSYLLQNLAVLTLGSVPKGRNISSELSESIVIGSINIPKLNILTVGVTAIVLVSLGAFLAKTRLGVQMRAAAEDFGMARILGVRANTVIAAAFAISGALAGIAAMILVLQTGIVYATMGLSPVLVAFIATVLGGMGSLKGAILGAYVLGTTTVVLSAHLPLELRYYRDAFVYGLVILIFLVRPQGLIVARSVATRV